MQLVVYDNTFMVTIYIHMYCQELLFKKRSLNDLKFKKM